MNALDICNMALSELKCKSISSIDDAYSAEAKQCKQFYAASLTLCLSKADWEFAAKELNLSRIAGTPMRYAYKYAVPADCARPVCVWDMAIRRPSTAPWEVIGQELHTDLVAVPLYYVSKDVVTGEFPETFCLAACYHLASLLSIPLKGEKSGKALSESFLGKFELQIQSVEKITDRYGQVDQQPPAGVDLGGNYGSDWTRMFV